MARDPEYLEFIRRVAEFIASTPPQTIEQERAGHTEGMANIAAPEVALVVDMEAGGVPARLYHPAPGTVRPGFVFFHGGGFYLGTVAAYDPLVRVLVQATGCAFVSVDYRLAPEHQFPAGVRDALAATKDIVARTADLGIDPARLGVAGDSAGANLAAVVARHLRRSLALQLLAYGVYDLSTEPVATPDPDGISLDDGGWSTAVLRYLGEANPADPDASPLLAPFLVGVPPAIIVNAEYDHLTQQGNAYAQRLREAKVDVTVVPGTGLDHAFLAWGGFARRPAEAVAEVGAAVRAAFGVTVDA